MATVHTSPADMRALTFRGKSHAQIAEQAGLSKREFRLQFYGCPRAADRTTASSIPKMAAIAPDGSCITLPAFSIMEKDA